MGQALSLVLFALAVVGLALLVVQTLSLAMHLRAPPAAPDGALPPISILKPLCGLDDDLTGHLSRFATLDYPDYELLLGISRPDDPAAALAHELAARYPGRVRVIRQRGEPGLNPKVNQLITLAAAARYDLLVISDSNVTVDPSYLRQIAGHFNDPEVGLVTHPIVGTGGEALGSRLDNLHLNSQVAPGVIAASRVVGRDLVVGKSMALRRADLRALGGFETVKDVLAEDHAIGTYVKRLLRKRVVLAHPPVINVSKHSSTAHFFRRYARWSVMHRQAIGNGAYLAELLLNPSAFTVLAVALHPNTMTLTAGALLLLAKTILDSSADLLLRDRHLPFSRPLEVALKDLLLFAAWLYGLTHQRVRWRGNELRVLRGTRLVPTEAPAAKTAQAKAY